MKDSRSTARRKKKRSLLLLIIAAFQRCPPNFSGRSCKWILTASWHDTVSRKSIMKPTLRQGNYFACNFHFQTPLKVTVSRHCAHTKSRVKRVSLAKIAIATKSQISLPDSQALQRLDKIYTTSSDFATRWTKIEIHPTRASLSWLDTVPLR